MCILVRENQSWGRLPEVGTQRMLLTDGPFTVAPIPEVRMPCGLVAGLDGERFLWEPSCEGIQTGLEVPGH